MLIHKCIDLGGINQEIFDFTPPLGLIFQPNLGPKWPQNEVFWGFLKIGSLVFPDFLHDVRGS